MTRPLLIATLSIALLATMAAPVSAQEPGLVQVLTDLGFTDLEEAADETFPAGTYDLRLLAEFAEDHADQSVSYYPIGTDTFAVLLPGPEGNYGITTALVTTRFASPAPFGLSMLTPKGQRFFTETTRNIIDGSKHARVFRVLSIPGAFVIGFEDTAFLGDDDYQDVIVLLTPPRTVSDVFDTMLASCQQQFTAAALNLYQQAFTSQLTQPIVAGLRRAGASGATITRTRSELIAARQALAGGLRIALDAPLDSQSLLPTSVRRLRPEVFAVETNATIAVSQFEPHLGDPRFRSSQSIRDILRHGFDQAQIDLAWDGLGGACAFPFPGGRAETPLPDPPRIVATEIQVTLTTACKDDGGCSSAEAGSVAVKGGPFDLSATVNMSNMLSALSAGVSVSYKF